MSRSLLPRNDHILAASEHPTFSSRELAFELLVTKAILRSLDIDQILYVVLSGITSGDGLGFHRAVLLLADEAQRWLTTRMAIGPVDAAEAHRIWEAMEAQELTLEALLLRYDAVRNDSSAHKLTHQLRGLQLRLDDLEDRLAAKTNPLESGESQVSVYDAMIHVLARRTTLASSNVRLVYYPDDSSEPFFFEQWRMVPLLSSERIVGLLLADSPFGPHKEHGDIESLLIGLSNLTAIAVEKSLLFQKLEKQAQQDGLTGVANRRLYDEQSARMLTVARQTRHPLSLILVDVDFFKQYNDTYGHLAGDEALKFVAHALSDRARSTDLVARYGGEEFTVLLPNTTADQAEAIARELLDEVRQKSAGGNDTLHPLTISAGVTCTTGEDETIEEVFARADTALYQAKSAGRDQVRVVLPSKTSRAG